MLYKDTSNEQFPQSKIHSMLITKCIFACASLLMRSGWPYQETQEHRQRHTLWQGWEHCPKTTTWTWGKVQSMKYTNDDMHIPTCIHKHAQTYTHTSMHTHEHAHTQLSIHAQAPVSLSGGGIFLSRQKQLLHILHNRNSSRLGFKHTNRSARKELLSI